MIGDRFLTDVAFGNRLGMLTIRPEPFTSEGETRTVRAVRCKTYLVPGGRNLIFLFQRC